MGRLHGAPLILIISGAVIGGGVFLMMIGGFDMVIKFAITMQVRLVNNSDTWNQWKTIPIPVYLRVRVFNITNPEEIEFGIKPKLMEMGPYVYREEIFKVDITENEAADTVRYRQIRNYFFEQEMSKGAQDDIVTMINIPYVGVAKLAHEFTDVEFLLNTLDDMLSSKGEKLTRQEKVSDLLFHGFNVQVYVDLANDPLVQNAGDVKLPEKILDGKMGLLEGKNGSDEGWMVVKTGKENSKDFGRVVSYNGELKFKVWNGETCNMINGTDGIIFQPFLKPEMRMQALVPDLCRSIHFDYTETVEYDGVPAYRFRQPKSMYASPKTNPANQCFCPINATCTVEGLIPVGPCLEGAPLFISQPHLLFVDKEIQDKIEGLNPDPELHWGYMDLNPTTGVALEAKHRLQFNMQVTNWPAMPTFSNVTDCIIPIMWVEEGATLVGKNKVLLQLLAGATKVWKYGQFFFFLFGIAVLPGLGFLIMKMRKKKNEVKLVVEKVPSE